MFDYEFQTTFWEDFCICEKYWSKENNKGLLEYFNNAFDVAKDNYKMLTELVLVLNWKTWKYSEIQDLSRLYAELQVKTDAYAMENLKGEELDYYIRETQY